MRLLAAFLALSTSLLAQAPAATKDTAGGDPTIDLYRSLADYFRVSEKAVQTVRSRVSSDEEIAPVLMITKRSSASANMVLDARKAGKDWPAILSQFNVKNPPANWLDYANARFLADYHGRTEKDIEAMHAKGLSWIAINQEFRRDAAVPDAQSRRSRSAGR